MKLFSNTPFKSLAAAAAAVLMFSAPIAQAYSYCESMCSDSARRAAEGARAQVIAKAASTCAGVPEAGRQNCIDYQKNVVSQQVYNSVYSQAYYACLNQCTNY